MDFRSYFEGKNITVMGLGLLGRGVGDVRFLAEQGVHLIVTDRKTSEELAPSLAALEGLSNITYVLGEHRMEDFRDRDMILKAAGVPLDSPYIEAARAEGIPIEMSASLFMRLSGIPVIGITGTRGKSTVTHLIHHVLSQAVDGEVLLGGNVRGVSTLSLLGRVREESIAVLELDSWQLQGFGESRMSPHIAVFTNFMDDHLNYYGGDRNAYFADKAHIFLYQESGDTFITTPAVFARAEDFAHARGVTFSQNIELVDDSVIPEDWAVPLAGAHNRMNTACAVLALRVAGIADEQIRAGIETFPGVPGRLEFVGERKGVKIFNDNNATTPEATLAALEAVSHEHNAVLIMGGSDKGSDMSALMARLPQYAKHVVLLAGTGTDTIRASLPAAAVHDTLAAAIDEAFDIAEDGDVVLFSPAFASFGMFKNEYDRNDQFMELIRTLP